MLRYSLRTHGIELELRLADALPPVQADGDQIGQVVLNLLVNAQQALAATRTRRGCVRVETGSRGAARRPRAAGLAARGRQRAGRAAAARRIFEPFFTTKPEGSAPGSGCRCRARWRASTAATWC